MKNINQIKNLNLFYKPILILSLIIIFSALTANQGAASLSCQITNTTDCAQENIFIKMKSQYVEEYNNSHAETRTYNETGYPYSICCEAQNQELIFDCGNENAIEVLRLAEETNTHIQFASNYNNLLHHWRLNNNFLNSITSNHATNNGVTWTNDRRGNTNSAISFSGSNHVDLNFGQGLNPANEPHTFTMWVRADSTGTNRMFMSAGQDGGTNNRFYIGINGGNWDIGIQSTLWGSGSVSATTNWTHIALVMTGNEAILYVNGEVGRTISYTSYSLNNNIWLGKHDSSFYWVGEMDDVKIYDRALSLSEIESLANDGTIGYWKLNNNLLDYSGNENHATNNGATWTLNRYGVENQALKFDGTSNVEISSNIIPQNADFALSFWLTVNANVSDGSDIVAIGTGPNSANRFYIYSSTTFGAANNQMRVWDSSLGELLIGNDLRGRGWTHIIITRQNNDWALYENNKLIDTTTQSGSIVSHTVTEIGGGSPDNRYHEGNIDNVIIFNRTISNNERNALFIEGKTKYAYPVCIGGLGSSECIATTNSCPQNFECVASMASSEGWDYTNAHIASCNYYSLNICCSVTSPPSIPDLVYPENNDSFFINRTPTFNWTEVIDPQGLDITYHFQLSINEAFTGLEYNETTIDNYYEIIEHLELRTYYWRVRAYNGDIYSEWSEVFNFTIVPHIQIFAINNSINFGILTPGDENSTENNNPTPFRFRNDGNVESDLINMTVSQPLWVNEGFGTNYWNITIRPEDSFNTSNSLITWTNIESVMYDLIKKLNYTGNREVSIDIALRVPIQEPAGEKASNLTFYWGVHS